MVTRKIYSIEFDILRFVKCPHYPDVDYDCQQAESVKLRVISSVQQYGHRYKKVINFSTSITIEESFIKLLLE